VRRAITGFHLDDEGHHVAELSCLHGQHVRHQPPWQERPWVLTEEGRATWIGRELDCVRCDEAELPEGLEVVRTAGPFDESSVPAGLQRAHRVAAATWGRLHVLEGRVRFTLQTAPPLIRELVYGDRQPIPPEVEHEVTLIGPVRLEVDFLVRRTV
jgi:tellurite resistance-related uncharacterized protein